MADINTRKPYRYFLTITDAFLNQKRVNVYENTVKMTVSDKSHQGGCDTRRGNGTKIEWKLSENNNRLCLEDRIN